MRCKKSFLLILLIALVLNSYSQNKGNTIDLKNILETLSKEHLVTFNYLDTDLALLKIIPPQNKLSLQEKLDYISKKTQLNFLFVTKNYISVVKSRIEEKMICGILIDYDTKEKISNASIHFTGTNNFTVSDKKGFFELPANTTASSIEINHLAYDKIVLETNDLATTNCTEILLKAKSSQLNEVVAEVFLTKGISKKTNGSFEIQPKKFGILPGLTEPDVLQTLQQLPGIISVDETVSNINVRGGSHDQNLFLWNEIRLFQTGHFYGLISILNPNLANKITVIKNGTSAFYDESVSSTVTIETSSDSISSTSSVGVNMINIDFNTTVKTSKKSSLQISGRRADTDLFASPTYKNYYQRIFQNTVVTTLSDNKNIDFTTDKKFYFYDGTLQFKQQIKENTSLLFNALAVSNQLDIHQSKNENNSVIQKSSFLEQQTLGGSLVFATHWNSKNSSKLIMYGSFYKINAKNESITGNQIFTQENSVLDTGIKIENSHILSPIFTFKNGYQFNEIGIRNYDQVNTPAFSKNTKEVLQKHALITELHYLSPNNKLHTSFGIRSNYITKFQKYIFEPRLQMDYQVSNSFSTQLLGEIKHQTSSQIIDLQQDFLGVEKRRWVLSNNTDIPIITSNQLSIGFTFKKKNWLLSIDNFYKKVEGINSKSQGFQNQLEFENIIGQYTVIGSEFLIQKQIFNFTSWLNYSLTKNTYTFESYVPPKFPNNFEIQQYVGMGLIYDYKQFKIALGSKLFTGKPVTLPSNNNITNNEITYDEPNSQRLKNYFQTNISAGYNIDLKTHMKLQMGTSIQNIFNSKNIINQYFRINQNTQNIEKINTFSLQRTPNAFVRLTF